MICPVHAADVIRDRVERCYGEAVKLAWSVGITLVVSMNFGTKYL